MHISFEASDSCPISLELFHFRAPWIIPSSPHNGLIPQPSSRSILVRCGQRTDHDQYGKYKQREMQRGTLLRTIFVPRCNMAISLGGFLLPVLLRPVFSNSLAFECNTSSSFRKSSCEVEYSRPALDSGASVMGRSFQLVPPLHCWLTFPSLSPVRPPFA
jgi:hypothetical protein